MFSITNTHCVYYTSELRKRDNFCITGRTRKVNRLNVIATKFVIESVKGIQNFKSRQSPKFIRAHAFDNFGIKKFANAFIIIKEKKIYNLMLGGHTAHKQKPNRDKED